MKAKFIERPNRFVAVVETENQPGVHQKVHVKNTGRCRELLVPGATVYLEDFEGRMGTRKMRYSLTGVEKESRGETLMVNMDSQAPNKVVHEALLHGGISLEGMGALTLIRPEKTYGSSRFDFYCEDGQGAGAFIEVKGVTLENDRICAFPDAPTLRGVKHIMELARAAEDGFRAYIIFVIQMEGMTELRPNDETHPEFGDALRHAAGHGVTIKAYQCRVSPDSLEIGGAVPVNLG